MPNWCSNSITLAGSAEDITKFEKFLNEKNGKDWFDFFLPCPQELKDGGPVGFSAEPPDDREKQLLEKYGASDWYTWSVNNWGCKWNCDAQDWNRKDNEITFWFDSPWGPPTELYSHIYRDTDFAVDAEYHEEGMCFVGRFADGEDESYEYSDLNSLNEIPDDLIENWNIRDMLEEQAEWDNEDEEEFEEDREILDSHYPDGDGYWKEEDKDGKTNS
jgi:hypothetical protein